MEYSPRPLSIWQYTLLGGPPQTVSSTTRRIDKYKGNYVDIAHTFRDIENRGREERNINYSFVNFIYAFFGSPSESLVDSIRPSLITLLSIVGLIFELVLSIISGISFTADEFRSPLLISIFSLAIFIFFSILSSVSVWYWAINSKYRAYVPLVNVNVTGMILNGVIILLIFIWILDYKGLEGEIEFDESDVDSIHNYIKYHLINILYISFTVAHICIYFHTIIDGYQKYLANYGIVVMTIENEKEKMRNIYSGSPVYDNHEEIITDNYEYMDTGSEIYPHLSMEHKDIPFNTKDTSGFSRIELVEARDIVTEGPFHKYANEIEEPLNIAPYHMEKEPTYFDPFSRI